MSIIKKDYSATCDLNDDDLNNPCEKCLHYIFPIGCMLNENFEVKEGVLNEIRKM